MFHYLFFYYILIINVIAFAAFGIDKWKAVTNRWRIKEATLLFLCALGGGIGGYLAMRFFHHKTKKAKFYIGVPLLLLVWILAAVLFYRKYDDNQKGYAMNMNKKTVVCYGDSNTYGYNPETGRRYPETVRWTGRLKSLLGDEYRVIEEGCNGRTTIYEDPVEGWKSGLPYLKPCLNSHKPVDLLVLMLGTNDLKKTFHLSAQEIAVGAEQLVETAISFTKEKQGKACKVILISPMVVGERIHEGPFSGSFDETAYPRSKEFAKYYEEVALKHDCIFCDAATWVESSEVDQLHLSAEAHAAFAENLAQVIKEIDA